MLRILYFQARSTISWILASCQSFGSKERQARKLGARRAAKENEIVIREEHGGT